MKGIIGIFVVGVVACIVSLVILKKGSGDDSHQIAMGFGEPKDNQIQMDLAVGSIAYRRESARVDRVTGMTYWDEWIDNHYQLLDNNRQTVKLNRIANTSVISKLGGTEEFFLSAKLNCGEEYTFDYIPIKAEGKRFRHVFTAPSEKGSKRPLFALTD